MPEPNYVADKIGGCRSSYDLIQLNNIVSIAPNECVVMQPNNLVLNIMMLPTRTEHWMSFPWFVSFEPAPQMRLLDNVLLGSLYKNDTVLSVNDPNCFICPLILMLTKHA